MKYTVATIGSHSALQILKGAKDEGFKTLCILNKENYDFYKNYNFIDKFEVIKNYSEMHRLEQEYSNKNLVMIPHGSFVAYLGKEFDAKTSFKYFGNKKILEVEADRITQNNWLNLAGLKTPKVYSSASSVDRPVIVKTYGAKGGFGYQLVGNKYELAKIISKIKNDQYLIQEYILGTPAYIQFFYSPLSKKLELIGCDRRYESTIDGLGRIPLKIQTNFENNLSFTVIGNFPIVLRESLLPKVFSLGQKIVDTSIKIAPPYGLYGPFCLETVIDSNLNIYAIEISCRIVAGTNLFINGSPYTDLLYRKPMSMGRRIALEIKKAIKIAKLDEILT